MSITSTIDPKDPFSSLNASIHQHTDRRYWVGRLWQTVKTAWQHKGALTGVAVSSSMTVAKVYTAYFAYLCFEGSYRSLDETFSSIKEEGHLVREIGDAGGWTSLGLFALLALGVTLNQCIREAEYLNLKPICQKWHKEATSNGIAISEQELYSKINDLLDMFSSQCFFSKNPIERKIAALEIMDGLGVKDQEMTAKLLSELDLDRLLRELYQEIQTDLETQLSSRAYFHRLRKGFSSIQNSGGITGSIKAILNGLICPTVLFTGAICSAIGTVILGKQVLGDKEDLLATGHVGEWPFNAVEAFFVALWMHKLSLLKEGDLALSKDILKKYVQTANSLQALEEASPETDEHLLKLANLTLKEMAATCYTSKYPLDYELNKNP